MKTLEGIIGNYNGIKEGGIISRKHFLNIRETNRNSWLSRRKANLKFAI
ncbi:MULTISPECIES: hypothetical protein [Antarcticibacterium]|nr:MULTISPECIES: hypothetical protein [Antarcticibacterium]